MGVRDVAQLGSALPWGGRGHGFKSHRSDHLVGKQDWLERRSFFQCDGHVIYLKGESPE